MRGADFQLSGDAASFELRIDFDRVRPTEDGLQWLICHCACEVDAFRAEFPLGLTRQDLEQFHAQLSMLRSGVKEEIELENLEMDFRLGASVRSTGAVSVVGKLTPGYTRSRATLDFAFDSDLASIDTATHRIAAAVAALRKLP